MRKTSRDTSKNTLMRVAIYIRVSTDKQAKEGESVRDQLASAQKYIDAHENMILADTYIDDGISGQKLIRDDFNRLINDVQAGLIDLIIFTRLDRWFRNLRHYLNVQDTLDKFGVSWTAIEQPYFDTSTPHGRAFVNNSMIWAELEAQNDSDRLIGIFKEKTANGEVLSGATPLGYSIVNKHLVPNEDAPKVVAIFNYYCKCGSISKTLHYMEEELGLVRSLRSLKNTLTTEKYIGVFRNNYNYCPPIISKELFDEVQRLLSVNIKCGKKNDYIFSGIIMCAECGRHLSGSQLTINKGFRKDGTKRIYKYKSYRCQQALNLHRCPNKKLNLETTLEKTILKIIRPESEKYIAQYEIECAPTIRNDTKRKNIENKIKKLKDLYLNDLLTLEEYKIDREKLLSQISELETKETKPPKDLTALRDFLNSNFEELYSSLSDLEKQQLWRSIIREIRVDKDKNISIIFL